MSTPFEKDRLSTRNAITVDSSRMKNVSSSRKVTREIDARDAANAVEISRRFLTVLGLWRTDEVRNVVWRMALANISVILYYIAIVIRTIPSLIYAFVDANSAYLILMLMCRTGFAACCGLKYILLHFHQNDITKCMRYVRADWTTNVSPSNRNIMLKYSRYAHLVTKYYAIVKFVAAIGLALLPYLLKMRAKKSRVVNATEIVKQREFPTLSNFYFDIATRTPYFEILYTVQSFATFMLHSIDVSAMSLAIIVGMHACGKLNILEDMIDKIIDGDDESKPNETYDERFSKAIKQHVKSLKFISAGERMLREICLVDLAGCTIQMCFAAYFILWELRKENMSLIGPIVYGILLVTFAFNIFTFCYIGELLTQEWEQIGFTTYMIDWHRLTGKQPYDLCLIILMAQTPTTLTAGGAIPLSYVCFTSVIKTSAGYFNMLRAMTA